MYLCIMSLYSTVSLCFLAVLLAWASCGMAIPSPPSYDVKVTVGTSPDELQRHPIYTKITLMPNGEQLFFPEDMHMPVLAIKACKVSDVSQVGPSASILSVATAAAAAYGEGREGATHAPPTAKTPIGWHYFVVTNTEANVDYYVANPDKNVLENLRHSKSIPLSSYK